jgi:GNAT superfamily N-acetyltransferase
MVEKNMENIKNVQYHSLDCIELLDAIKKAYKKHEIIKYDSYLEKCYEENKKNIRKTIVATINDQVAGIAHLVLHSRYPYFKESAIPEISDLYVFEPYRKKGIATHIIEMLETHAKMLGYKDIGLCVGLFKDYGSAQKLYQRLGYVLDGKGIVSHDVYVIPGEHVLVDDDLNICLIKNL